MLSAGQGGPLALTSSKAVLTVSVVNVRSDQIISDNSRPCDFARAILTTAGAFVANTALAIARLP